MSYPFDYEAMDPDGRALKGRIEALSVREAQRQLEGQGLAVVELAPAKAGTPTGPAALLRGGVTIQDRILTLKQLALLLKSGVALVSGISTLKTQAMHPAMTVAFA